MAITVLPYLSPRIVVVPAPDTEITAQELVDELRDWEDDPDNAEFLQIISAAGKEPLGSGTQVGITATLQNAQVYFEARSTPLTVGESVTTLDSAGETCIASAATFSSDGVARGDLIYNATTGAMASVLSVDSEIQITSLPLTGGTRNDWQIGDSITVWDQTLCNITGGNVVAVDENQLEIPAVFESGMINVVRTASSSATIAAGSGITEQDKLDIADRVWDETAADHVTAGTMGAKLELVRAILNNRTETNPSTGVMTIYADDDVTPLYTANVYEDVGGATPYAGSSTKIDRRNRFT